MSDLATDLAYMAGILDGEGCITILRRKAGGARKSPSHNAQIVVTSSTREMLVWIEARWGGVIHPNRAVFAWHLSGQSATDLLLKCMPYLVVKAEQARVVIALYEEVQKSDPRSDPTTIERREALHAKIKSMHSGKGFAHVTS